MAVFGKIIGYIVVTCGLIAVCFGALMAFGGGDSFISGSALVAGVGVAFWGVLLAGFGTGIVLLAELLEAVDGIAYLQRLRERPSMRSGG